MIIAPNERKVRIEVDYGLEGTLTDALGGEIITVITRQSDDYLYIPTLWAAIIALALPALLNFIPSWSLHYYSYPLQVIGFFALSILFRWPPLKMRLIPKSVKYRRAKRFAHKTFLLQGLHHTEDRVGIMLFVFVAERYVEIIADQGINDAVEPAFWKSTVAEFIKQVKQKQIANGYLAAISACATMLELHFPAKDDQLNELPDHLIEL